MSELLERLSMLVEVGKINKVTPYPPEMKDMDGASEITQQALERGIDPQIILNDGLMPGMSRIGEKFARGEAFIPNMLISAKAMNAAMDHLKPFFDGGEMPSKGTLIIGTVKGDLHDIGKNLVKMIMEGDGWSVIDLGTDVGGDKFVKSVNEHKEAIIGISALLTTTMLNMEEVITKLRENNSSTKIFVGGAAVSKSFSEKIGADGYFRDPYSFAQSFN